MKHYTYLTWNIVFEFRIQSYPFRHISYLQGGLLQNFVSNSYLEFDGFCGGISDVQK